MIFLYKVINKSGGREEGEIDAFSADAAIAALQRKGQIVLGVTEKDETEGDIMKKIPLFNRVSNKDVVILSRQMAILFEAQVSALRIFKLLGTEHKNPILRKHLLEIVDDLQRGVAISAALAKHPKIFSGFYVNMVRAGEESGQLDKSFSYLADYLDRTYEVTSKAKNALIYPAFVIFTFISVMILMFTVIVPKIANVIKESSTEIPIYTRIVFALSDFFVHSWIYIAVGVIVLVGGLIWYARTEEGRRWISNERLHIPYVGELYRKLYLSRFADNMSTMVGTGIPMLKALEVTASVIDNEIYKEVLEEAITKVKGGKALSNALSDSPDVPSILTQMVRVGEETGELGNILKTMSKFYQREVLNAVDTLVSLIEPVMIVTLGIGVGVLLASILMPIYNIASATT